jgi:hypothetical protein
MAPTSQGREASSGDKASVASGPVFAAIFANDAIGNCRETPARKPGAVVSAHQRLDDHQRIF